MSSTTCRFFRTGEHTHFTYRLMPVPDVGDIIEVHAEERGTSHESFTFKVEQRILVVHPLQEGERWNRTTMDLYGSIESESYRPVSTLSTTDKIWAMVEAERNYQRWKHGMDDDKPVLEMVTILGSEFGEVVTAAKDVHWGGLAKRRRELGTVSMVEELVQVVAVATAMLEVWLPLTKYALPENVEIDRDTAS